MSGYVYFLRNPITNLVKIGYSIEPHKRKEALEREHGVSLEVVAVARSDDPRKLEQALHALVDSERVEGEWFRLERPVERLRNTLADKLLDWSEAVRVTPPSLLQPGQLTVREKVKRYIEESQISQRQVALALDIIPQYLNSLLNDPSDTVPSKLIEVMDYLGLRLVVVDEQGDEVK